MRRLPYHVVAAMLVLAGCASQPSRPPVPAFDGASAAAAVRAAGEAASIELDVRPLVDPAIADLREQAVRLEADGRLADAAGALDQALSLSPDDPLLLQERAELALLQDEPDRALELAMRSHAAGPQVGPLCRRQQEVLVQVEQARAAAGDALAAGRAAAAREAREACTVTPAPRY